MKQELILPIPINTIFKLLAILTVVLCTAGFLANVYIYQIAEHPDTKSASLMQRFDLGFEPSIPGYYSVMILLSCSILLWVASRIKTPDVQNQRIYWQFLSLIFFYLSVDEAVMIHEMTDTVLHEWLQTSGIFYLAWVIPGILFVGFVGTMCVPFLIKLEAVTRNRFLIAGMVFVGGAIGMEMVASLIIEGEGVQSIKHSFCQTIEEGMEMTGGLIFMHAIIRFIQSRTGIICLTLDGAKPPAEPTPH